MAGTALRAILAQPRGFCAGVVRAIEIVERALRLGPPVYVRHEIVHNRHVVEALKAKGARFVEDWRGAGGRGDRSSARMAVARPSTEAEARGAAGDRRHLPAGHQGPQQGRRYIARGVMVI